VRVPSALLVVAATSLLALPAQAMRPTEGGMFSFDASDVVEHWDEPGGAIRVHYSVDGPNVTLLDDVDADGAPDFPQAIAITTAEVLDFYEAETGLRWPLTEDQMGLSELGGSYALDVYLVDFDGNGDGAFGIDTCTNNPLVCSGYLTIENDFYGQIGWGGYASLQAAVDVLTSHELFHGIQNAYFGDQPIWLSEGTATWGELQFDPVSLDFMWFADQYLEDAARSLDRPPTGPVPAFAYGTCLWWDFFTTHLGVEAMHQLLLATEAAEAAPVDVLEAMEQVIVDSGETLEDLWIEFASWNLATGSRAGAMDSYGFAGELHGIDDEQHGDSIDDDNRFYPLAATYYQLEHDGGPIWFGVEESAEGLHFALHPVQGGQDDGPVLDAVDRWTAPEAASWALSDGEDFAAGGYWLVGTYPARADESVKVRFCLGDQSDAEQCAPAAVDDGDDDDDDDDGEGCACTQGASHAGGSWTLALLALWGLARIRAPRRARA
jgi:hypothetical protein